MSRSDRLTAAAPDLSGQFFLRVVTSRRFCPGAEVASVVLSLRNVVRIR